MKKSNHLALRALLREHPDGLTPGEMLKILGRGRDHSTLTRSLGTMPDAYIDRWVRIRGQYAAVWCVVVPPPHCPRPDIAAERYGQPKTKWATVESTTITH